MSLLKRNTFLTRSCMFLCTHTLSLRSKHLDTLLQGDISPLVPPRQSTLRSSEHELCVQDPGLWQIPGLAHLGDERRQEVVVLQIAAQAL